jgi:hypothetical protein
LVGCKIDRYGPETYACKLVSGDKEAARAKWRNYDGYDPRNCTEGLTVEVRTDAEDPIKDASITVTTKGFKEIRQTDRNGQTVFWPPDRTFVVHVEKQGYMSRTKTLIAGEDCDIVDCKVVLFLSESSTNKLEIPECTMDGEVAIKVVLEWKRTSNNPQADLDLWIRRLECSESVLKRYSTVSAYQNDPHSTEESNYCSMKTCDGDESCSNPILAGNQFSKWVFFKTRYADNLYNKEEQEADRPAGEGSIRLEVDKQKGPGPETISLKNPPPGTYQLLASSYQRSVVGGTSADIRNAHPTLVIALASNVQFTCTMQSDCVSRSLFWYVGDLKVEEDIHGKRSYRIKDVSDKTHTINSADLPLKPNLEKGEDTFDTYVLGTYRNDKYIHNVCTGKCTAGVGYDSAKACVDP